MQLEHVIKFKKLKNLAQYYKPCSNLNLIKLLIQNQIFCYGRQNNYKYVEKNIPKKFDIIYLDTIHAAHHVKKILYYYFNKLKKDGVFVIDDVSYMPYLKNREKNNFSLEINNLETFEILLEILNVNHKNIHLDFSTCTHTFR